MTIAVDVKNHGNREVFTVLGGRRAFHSGMAVKAELKVRVCKACGFVMHFVDSASIQDVSFVDALGDFKEEPQKHPLYQEYLREDHSYKSYDGANLLKSFGRWLQKRGN